MFTSRVLAGGVTFLLAVFSSSARAQPDALRRQAESLKPTAAELRWQQIPWELDLHEALKQAKSEKRPIFFWAAGGRDRDGVPLERC